jgi:HAD superfamily hydrolase (TIGR01509 family)
MITTVVFDLDGLLTDTERLHCHAYQKTLSEIGISLTEEEYAEHWIRAGLGIREFVEARGIQAAPPDLRKRKTEVYGQLVDSSLEPMPGALELLQQLQGRKRLALASSAFRDSVLRVLRKLDIESFFEVIATEGSTPRRKPFPDLFLYTAEQLGEPPAECVVLEDAEKGVIAAHAAGMKSIAVPNRFTRGNDFSKATMVVHSLHDVTLGLLDSLG